MVAYPDAPFWEGAPTLPPRLERIHEAFWRLSPSRSQGWGAGPIPFDAIDRYAARYGFQEFEEFDQLIRAMDAVYLGHQGGRMSRAPKGGEK